MPNIVIFTILIDCLVLRLQRVKRFIPCFIGFAINICINLIMLSLPIELTFWSCTSDIIYCIKISLRQFSFFLRFSSFNIIYLDTIPYKFWHWWWVLFVSLKLVLGHKRILRLSFSLEFYQIGFSSKNIVVHQICLRLIFQRKV